MVTDTEEEYILEEAVAAFHQATGLPLTITALNIGKNTIAADATLRLQKNITLRAEIKKNVQTNIGAVIQQIKWAPNPDQAVLVAKYIPPQKAEALKQADVQFIDMAGNAYIHQPPTFIYTRGNKLEKTTTGMKTGKAFKPAGLKVVFALLLKNELVNAPYRTIAEIAGVALANIGAVLDDLKLCGFINTAKTKNRRLCNTKKLLYKWAEAFPILQNKHHIGTFTTDIPFTWETIKIADFGGLWGGEIAAADYTQYLTPKDVTIYVPKTKMNDIMRIIRLRKIKHGELPNTRIDLYEPFWTEQLTPDREFVHAITTFAELICTGEARNLEAAQKLYEKYLG